MSISPNVPNPQESYHYDNLGTPRWIAVLFALLFAALGLLAYAGHSVQSRLEQELSKSEDQNKILERATRTGQHSHRGHERPAGCYCRRKSA